MLCRCRQFRGSPPADSSDSTLPQRTGPLDLNKALFCIGLGPHGLCHKEMMRAGAYPIHVKLSCPLWLLYQWEERAVVELPCPLEVTEVVIAELLAQYEEMAIAELPCPLEVTEVVVVQLLAQYEEMTVAELHVEQEWQVHVLQVTTSVSNLIVYTASVVISAHLRKFLVGSII
jgi:hypothetical protein